MDNFPEKEAWDRLLSLNVKSIFYSMLFNTAPFLYPTYFLFVVTVGYDTYSMLYICTLYTTILSLADLLAKDSVATDPGRVINISSVASVNAHAEGSAVADKGMGLWSCKLL